VDKEAPPWADVFVSPDHLARRVSGMRPVCSVSDVPGLYPDKTAKPLKPKTLLKLLCEPLWLVCVLGNPVQIFMATGGDFQHYALRKIVRMQLFHGIANALIEFGLGFDQQQPFLGCFNFALPAVNRFDPRHNVDARS
jgi:hypothetical protein